ncbi:3-hydroxyacyl-CoA dehydrogenase NAD-binding domain-containing protein [Kineococcus xinjiangensis]|uniref:3-hydroxyacyl-CoA dehydrogenase NAD-binding domain-containing protein n=1 Tax=Kineococcus xinjiangensis TaxID=512762 RepID=UPI003CCBFD1E
MQPPSTTTGTGREAEGRPAKQDLTTRALLRVVDLPGGPGRLALITLDNGDPRRPTPLSPAAMESLSAALDEAERAGVVAVALTGKPGFFCAGADLKRIGELRERSDALATATQGHEVFRRLGEMSVPTFAYVNGLALGGGLELALHCTYRTVSTSAAALGLPECYLGLVPGWGGTFLLPHLIGPDAAVDVMIGNALANNRTLRGAQAAQVGIADVAFEPADFLEQSLRWTSQVLRGEVTVERGSADRSDAAWEAALAKGRALADARVHGAAPAPYRALDLIALARTADRDTAFAAEDEALGDLIMSDEARASIYAFHLVQRFAKSADGAPPKELARKVTKVGVVGAGLMASQLALLFLHRLKVPVVLTDLDDARVQKGLGFVRAGIDELHAKGRLSADGRNRLNALVSGSTDKAAMADADFVIEAVFEDLEVKRTMLRELEPLLREDCVIATNTSSLSVTAMSEVLTRPERMVGFHFFNPVAVLPLVEVARTPATDDATLATAFAVGRELKKTCVLVRDAPAFVVNRVSTRLFCEVMRAIDEGMPLLDAEHALDPLGLPMSPLRLAALVGPAVMLHVAESLHEAFPDRFAVSPNLQRWVDAGSPDLVTRKGAVELTPQAEGVFVQGRSAVSREELLQRVQDALADEVGLVLDEGVAASPQEVDVCLILGTGHPLFLGGITPYLDRTGASERVRGRRFLPPGVASAG